MKFIKYLVFTALLFPVTVMACQFATDCEVGSKCIKSSGSMYGSCVGGLNPGNSNDDKPVTYQGDLTGKKGNTCSFDLDCGIGGQCVKGGGIEGTCM